jgi:hypothetical protein
MDFRLFFSGIRSILINPVKYWAETDIDNRSVLAVRNSILLPLILITSISAVAGSLIFTNVELSPVYSLLTGINCFCLFFCTVYVTAFILKEITYPLDLGRDFDTSLIIIMFSITPFLLCQIISRLFESLLFMNVIGLYGLYIFWVGVEKILNPPQYKKMPLLIAATLTILVVYIATSTLLNILTDKIFFAFFS